MKQNGAVYFYNLNSERGRQIRMLCLTLGLKIRVVEMCIRDRCRGCTDYREGSEGCIGSPYFPREIGDRACL